ncbi:YGGT family-domain-containing protein [Dunaliella salina]|uniref:YGGT family-domain-containing protein n=1 Tax=Dunaliella salina TaxID=3046 RepID=A0ABQ7G9G6_DUNSA|nr:YGGT family-domain-containing protein [Dunaliella salina]|eukprot:KAF5831257.1 YGGT family-domain-containing protein [Dunaliella salina]
MTQLQPLNPIESLKKTGSGLIAGLQSHLDGTAHQKKRHVCRRERPPPSIVVPPRHGAKPFAAILPGDSVGEAVLTTGLLNFLNLYNSALIVRLVLTWFPNPPDFIQQPLATVTDPYLNLFRGIIPPLGGTLDLSPILAFITLNFFTSSAAALPCEVGPDGKPLLPQQQQQQQQRNPFQFMQPTRLQAAWQNRVNAQRSGSHGGDSSASV